jgi:FAD/FMN-containing dehydrogenase
MTIVNDVHSALNPTHVTRIERPVGLDAWRTLVLQARRERFALSVAGGRHAMGGQQFAAGEVLLDTTGSNAVLSMDESRGLLRIEAGAQWPDIVAATHRMRTPGGGTWAIRQKQTGVDAVTLGGSIAANAHGRGLAMRPLVDDIEDLTLIDADGELLHCSRNENPERFALAVGGYGLCGLVYAATLRLVRRRRVVRLVDVLDLADAMNAVYRRVDQGCIYGDFQFVIDPRDPAFLQRGVFACYRPVDASSEDSPPLAATAQPAPATGVGVVDDRTDDRTHDRHDAPAESADLDPRAWLELLRLAHDDKARAFSLYAQHYLGTHGKVYWADTMQLSTYLPSYADFLAAQPTADGRARERETLVIGEHYVPPAHLPDFMRAAREVLLREGVEVVYGTIRSILRDQTSFLPWAREDFACVIFNLRTPHTDSGRDRTARAFRGLTDAATALGGSFFLTYHRHATREQVLRAHPRIADFLQAKRRIDPDERFVSDWYRHMVRLVGEGTA